ncbi:hypothetical protein PILCRDRAFT_731177 [Piloderma croceum F 1598]|uniref:Uncharacterized protein n=1 Tax=Piloderma croceum (strain F 1598) TaxID=765440 RepID=A0A0C3EZZ2_PILCF|nr:hypothetical protein PILCRDRAFT_731177 [Piloderma croceum F 1598]
MLSRTTVMTRIPAELITLPYRRRDSNSWIRLTYGRPRGCILTVRSTAVAVYGTVDSHRPRRILHMLE